MRAIGREQVEAMSLLGFDQFAVRPDGGVA
jgi:uncharacterized protein (DUF934 family)